MTFISTDWSPNEIPTSAKMQQMSDNDDALKDGTGIDDNTLTAIKLALSAILDATNGVKTQANAGSAGGTMHYINLGGLKLLWGRGTLNVGGAGYTAVNFTLPDDFFTTVQSNLVSIDAESPASGGQYMYITSGNSNSSLVVTLKSSAATTVTFSIFVIGT